MGAKNVTPEIADTDAISVENVTSTTPFFSVLIVNFNGGDYLQAAVDSLKGQTHQDFELFVVDNASSDGSMAALDVSGLERVHLMAETENHGFAKGNNLPAKLAKGEWLVLLNPDAVADIDWLLKIKQGIETYSFAKMFASAQYSLDQPGIMDGAGDCYHIFGIPWRGGYGHPASEMPQTGECFSPCGAGAVFHRQTFLEAGGFDESFFCYCEDVDIAFRLRLQGERCVFLHEAMIHHAGSALSNKVGDFAVFHGTRNRFWVFIKNMPLMALILLFMPHLLITLCIFISRGCEKSFWRGFSEGMSEFSQVWAHRRLIQKQKTLHSFTILKSMSWGIRLLTQRKSDVRPIKISK